MTSVERGDIERIVVGVDGSEGARVALRWAFDEARRRQAMIEAVMAYDFLEQPRSKGHTGFDPHWSEADAAALLEREVATVAGNGTDVPVDTLVECDKPAPVLLRRSVGGTLLVVGARGMGGFKGLLLGSVSQACLAHAPGSVAIIPPTTPGEPRGPVVVGIDGSVESLSALEWAVDEVRRWGASLKILHARHFPSPLDFWEVPPDHTDRPTLEDRLRAFVDEAVGDLEGLDTTLTVVDEHPARALLDRGREARLVVVGARGYGGFAGLLIGSTSGQVARHAPCPVVVVREAADTS